MNELKPILIKNHKRTNTVILGVSLITFILVTMAGSTKLELNPGFDVHYFSAFNALINSLVTIFLIAGFMAIKQRKFILHRNMMLIAIVLSAIFLLSYLCYHFLTDSTKYGGTGILRYVYYTILISHVFLSVMILPVILYAAYRALTGEYERHKKLTRIAFPVWLYVSVTGVIVYFMISPYYN